MRTDDLAAYPIRALLKRNQQVDWTHVDDVILGCANQAGEDNRNVARMAALLAGLPISTSGITVNQLCASGMSAIIIAAQGIKSGEADLIIAGGVESMSRAPFVMPKATQPFSRNSEIYDTTIGWRFINPWIKQQYGVDSMPETGENVAVDFEIDRRSQDTFAYRSQTKAATAIANGRLASEITPITIRPVNGDEIEFSTDEHPHPPNLNKLCSLKPLLRENGTITAGNATGINDGAAALLIASERMVEKYDLAPFARILGSASVGVEPRIMGIGPVDATKRLCQRLQLELADFDVIEINEAFASQVVAVCRKLGIDESSKNLNPNGGAIALGHPLGMSGARITGTAALELKQTGTKLALATMCVGVGQGVAIAMESV